MSAMSHTLMFGVSIDKSSLRVPISLSNVINLSNIDWRFFISDGNDINHYHNCHHDSFAEHNTSEDPVKR